MGEKREIDKKELELYFEKDGWLRNYEIVESIYPENRKDICAIVGRSKKDAYDTLYLLWKNKEGDIKYKKIEDRKFSGDHLKGVRLYEEESVVIVTWQTEDSDIRMGYTTTKENLGIE